MSLHHSPAGALPELVVPLTDDGTLAVAWCISPDGARWPWLFTYDDAQTGCSCRECAGHEAGTGRLPRPWLQKLGRVCGAPLSTRDGTCVAPVSRFGDRCRQHEQNATSDRAAGSDRSGAA